MDRLAFKYYVPDLKKYKFIKAKFPEPKRIRFLGLQDASDIEMFKFLKK